MKPLHTFGFAALVVLMLATVLVITAFHQPAEPTAALHSLAMQSQVNPPQEDTDLSVVGSTTGIFIMGIVIVLIISLPLLLRKKRH